MAPSPTDFDRAHTYLGKPLAERLTPWPTVLSRLDHHARVRPGAPFLTTPTPTGDTVTLSYGEADALSRRLAAWLRRDRAVRPGSTVALAPVNDAASVLTVLAVLRAGCSLLMLSPQDPAARRRELTGAAGAELVLRPATLAAQALPEAVAVPDAHTLDAQAELPSDPAADPSAGAFCFATSGSTAAGKLVVQSHYAAAVNAEALRRHHGLRPGDRVLGCLPIQHVNGLHFTVLGVLAAGAHVLLAPGFDPLRYPGLLERFRPRIASVVPSILEALTETWRQPELPSDFHYFVSAAAPLSARTARAVGQRTGARVLQGYGLTETVNFSTTLPADLSEDAYRRLMLDTDIPTIGTALYGNEVAVLTSGGERAAPGEEGEICMRGHNVMTRYQGNEQATAEAFAGGWFHSQDLGTQITDPESGRTFVVVTGRRKNIAKVGGEAVSLDEVDRVLRAVPHLRDAASVALPHRFLGEEVVAAVVPAPGADAVAQARTALARSFRPTCRPGRIVVLEAIPRTATGKVLRRDLAATIARVAPSPESLPSPRSAT
ncbi:class I adenylate-forming enzyme family protein [Streptomyces sp. TG1A-8]|uniref:class I adenylate-forming enzyme family protein n=1 Tax=Streptomyces sp. TG1A-8 TaxID=3051385 RepID=UPI00265B7532|nr:class I adenylate-forming enzyme family protein [Streptomyces sp. TG1A-8]MDO0928873.1 class I adenylate-forming enzyme family protein [Streptomyces sp. TG1A-8]